MQAQLADPMSEHTLALESGGGCIERKPNDTKAISVSATITRLNEICQRLQAGQPLSEDLASWLNGALRRFLDHRTGSMQEAFGLRFPRGGVPWWREEAMRTRDAALRDLARCLVGDLSTNALAKHIHKTARRYGASTWRWDRQRDTMPAEYRGTPREFLWAAFRSGAPMPLGVRQLRNILADL